MARGAAGAVRWAKAMAVGAVIAGLAVAPAVAAAPSLKPYVLRAGEQTGFVPKGKPTRYPTLDALLRKAFQDKPAAYRTDHARLKAEGFRGALNQSMRSVADPHGSIGASYVMAFRSGAGARREARHTVRQGADPAPYAKGARIRRFAVSGVPGAVGWTAIVPQRDGGAANAVFVEGRCMLVVGNYLSSSDPAAPVIAGVQALYARTQGRCP